MTTRKYTSRSQQTTLTGTVTSGSGTISVVSASALLGDLSGAGISTSAVFTVVIDPDTSLEEIVNVVGVSGTTLTIQRAIDGSSAQDHSAGAVVRHMIIGRDLREANLHIEATGAYNDGTSTHAMHGLGSSDGTVVGSSQTATLTNKTIDATSNTITNISNTSISSTAAIALSKLATDPLARANHTGTQTASTISDFNTQVRTNRLDQMTAPTTSVSMNSQKLTSLATPTTGTDAANKSYVDAQVSNLVNGAPSTLDQLNELAAAIGNDANYSTTITTALATKLPYSGGTMTGAIAMGTNKITGLGDPTLAQDAVTKNYIDTLYGSTAAAATSATSAAASATAAATSATSAAASATAAATSATSAAASATAAATSATSAAASATTASNSATTATTQASNAANSATAAATSATSAAASATAAATSATSAQTYASNASTYATNALASQNAAATSATSASASATAAATSAASAATSATSAATSATSAATTYTNYDQRYLGSKASAPTVDNLGNALITGATYWNSTSSTMYAWTGSAWSAISTLNAYTAPTLGSQTIASGTTYTNINGLTINSTTIPTSKTLVDTTSTQTLTSKTLTSPTITGATLSLAADPSAALDAATKQYVDLVTAGVNYHATVVAASVSNLSANYNNGTSGVGATLTADTNRAFSTLDGQTVSVGQRILIKDQTTQLQNGIYTLTTVGSGAAPWVITRATDNDAVPELANGDVVNVTGGTVNSGKTFVNSTTGTITVGTTAITWASYYTGLPSQTGNAGNYLTTDGTTPSWSAVSSYSAPTLGSTSIASGATVTTINGLTKIVSATHASLDANSYEQDIVFMHIMGAW